MAGRSAVTETKTAVFQMRISPKVKKKVEDIYADCGMTLTDAINIFIQQSINVRGLPLLAVQDTKEAMKNLALAQLYNELRRGIDSEKDGVYTEEEVAAELGVSL